MSEQQFEEQEPNTSTEETSEGEYQEDFVEAASGDDRYNYLESKLSTLEQTNQQLLQMMQVMTQPKSAAQPEQPKISPEMAEHFAQNPQALAQFIQEQANQATSKISLTAARTEWDNRARREFPIDRDPKFKDAVLKEMSTFIQNGEFTKDSPTLMYRAAQLAAGKYKPTQGQMKGQRPGSKPTSLSSDGGGSQTEALKSNRSRVGDDDPRVRFYTMFKENPTKEDIANFKKKLETGTYTQHERRQRGKVLSR